MKPFTNQFPLTAYWEQGPNGGPALKAYKCPAGVWTIGFGLARNLPDSIPITEGMTCTEEQAKDWLNYCLSSLFTHIFHGTFKGELAWHQVAAITDYAYNCGMNAFPALLSYLKAGDIESASHEFLNGIYAKGKPLMGLLLRRISDYNTFTTGLYVAYEKGDPITPELKSLLLLKNGHNDAAVKMINSFKEIGG